MAARASILPTRPLRLGFIPLADAAPLVVAQERGLFSKHGLAVELSREVGWATLRDKIVFGELDAAPAPAGMLVATALGVGCHAADVLTGLVLNLHGNALTLSRSLWQDGVRDAATLREAARARRGERRLTFGVVYQHSSHHVMLRRWMRAAGLDPERDVRVVVVPPAQMVRNLVAGTIHGCCVGEPWNTVAIQAGAGWSPAHSAGFMAGHVEKVLMVRRDFAAARAAERAALIAALTEACAWCDEPSHRAELVPLLAGARYLNVPAKALLPGLTGRFADGAGATHDVPHFHVFHRFDANRPTVDRAGAVIADLVDTGLLPADATVERTLPRRLFREDLYQQALRSSHVLSVT